MCVSEPLEPPTTFLSASWLSSDAPVSPLLTRTLGEAEFFWSGVSSMLILGAVILNSLSWAAARCIALFVVLFVIVAPKKLVSRPARAGKDRFIKCNHYRRILGSSVLKSSQLRPVIARWSTLFRTRLGQQGRAALFELLAEIAAADHLSRSVSNPPSSGA